MDAEGMCPKFINMSFEQIKTELRSCKDLNPAVCPVLQIDLQLREAVVLASAEGRG
jgi:hypothetical protein